MPGGRPSKLNASTQKIICDAVRNCLPYATAATLAGVSYQTLHTWMTKGKQPDGGKYTEFLEALKKAEAEAQQILASRIAEEDAQKAKGWQRWAWLLERRWPETWAMRQPEANADEEIIVNLVGDD